MTCVSHRIFSCLAVFLLVAVFYVYFYVHFVFVCCSCMTEEENENEKKMSGLSHDIMYYILICRSIAFFQLVCSFSFGSCVIIIICPVTYCILSCFIAFQFASYYTSFSLPFHT